MPVKKKKAKKKAVKKRILKRKPVNKRIIRKKPAKKKIARKKPIKKKAAHAKGKGLEKLKIIGTITHYFPHVRAAVIKLKAPLSVGDDIKIRGHTTDFTQNVTSIQIDRVPIATGKKGDEIGLLVDSRVRQRDTVYKA